MRRARGFSRHIDETNEEGGKRNEEEAPVPHSSVLIPLSLPAPLLFARVGLTSERAHIRPLAVARAEIRGPPLLQVGLDLIEAALAVLRVMARDVTEVVERSDLLVRAAGEPMGRLVIQRAISGLILERDGRGGIRGRLASPPATYRTGNRADDGANRAADNRTQACPRECTSDAAHGPVCSRSRFCARRLTRADVAFEFLRIS